MCKKNVESDSDFTHASSNQSHYDEYICLGKIFKAGLSVRCEAILDRASVVDSLQCQRESRKFRTKFFVLERFHSCDVTKEKIQ